MATKAKSKKAAATRKRKAPVVQIPNHPFAPGLMVGFHPLAAVGMERQVAREPIPSPIKTAKVRRDGSLSVSGLGKGDWCAAAEVGERWRYFQFSVK